MNASALGPRGHADYDFLAAKRGRLHEPHIAPLTRYVETVRAETGGEVPWFDPDSGGVRARALFLLEAPGARATAATGVRKAAAGSGIISPDNNDGTAENSWRLYQDADLNRDLIAIWNIVPWYIGTATRIRAADRSDLEQAQPYLHRLLDLLPHLRVVLVFGDRARDGWLRYLLRDDAHLIPTLACPHPSPKVLNIHPDYRHTIVQALRKVRAVTEPDA